MWKCPKCGKELSRENQQHYCLKPSTVEEYILQQNEEVRNRLFETRSVIRSAIPDAEECISWSMPTYRRNKRNVIHFAASKQHLEIYPGEEAVSVFADRLKEYSVSKGTIRIPWDVPLPAGLIGEIAEWCYRSFT